jgi:hypothetical protein
MVSWKEADCKGKEEHWQRSASETNGTGTSGREQIRCAIMIRQGKDILEEYVAA